MQTRRFKMLLEEHRIELGRDQPVQMFVAHADTVTVRGRVSVMAIYRDQVERVTLPMSRASLKPARFRVAQSVRLERFGFVVDVKLARVPSPTSYGDGLRLS
ncbi:hypothetical protein F0U60_35705 [Archangium minus]|uniref:Uncharacterized protein n=1 Tax=Archangium minus TaxID=83450 RepID=A0ABY9X0F5_9BACT|nr:hypothetical protein F0U60_35705 [Archangium minus]